MPRLAFGPFEFDPATLELRRNGSLVRLQSQPARVLGVLVEKREQIVSREQLRQAIWGDSTYVDFESGLNFCISQLRSALRDPSSQPLYIRTVPRQGYQFIAPVRAVNAPEAPTTVAEASSKPVGRNFAPIAVAVAVLLAVAVVALRFATRSPHRAPPIVAVVRFDNETHNPALDSFANDLTDELVGQLADRGGGTYSVVGNAKALFQPRPQRDLRSIASTVNASYIVLGQVQSSGDQIRVLAHLIRASDQTHIWVVRLERPAVEMPRLDAELAEQIAATFATRLASNPDRAASFQAGSH